MSDWAEGSSYHIVDTWEAKVPSRERAEAYDALLPIPEFATFLKILRDWQLDAYKQAQMSTNADQRDFYLGGADVIDQIRLELLEHIDKRKD